MTHEKIDAKGCFERLVGGDFKLNINLDGGRISELKHGDSVILGSYQRIDDKLGSTHPCVPNFGDEGVELYGLPSHGPARNELWKIKSREQDSMVISCRLESIGKYRGTLYVEQEFVLGKKFRQGMRVENVGDREVPVNMAFHNYFDAPNGWQKLRINGVEVGDVVKKDAYISLRKEGEKNEILISDLKPITLIQKGMNGGLRLWVARKEVTGQIKYDENYVCIEPVIGKDNFFGSSESILKVGETREVWQEIYVE